MSNNKLPYLKSRRTILRKAMPNKLAQADQLLKDPECNLSEVNIIIQELEDSINRLESLTEEIVEKLVAPTEAEIEAEATKIEVDTAEIKSMMLLLTEKRRKAAAELDESSADQLRADTNSEIAQLRRELEQMRANGRVPSDGPGQVTAAVRLPKLEVEKFDGDILKFKEFWDHFEVAIGANRHLRPVEKLNYLRAYLTGDAKRVIAGLTATDENYDVAIALLRKRYGDTQASIDAHYSRLMDLQAVSNNTSRIRDLLDKIESHLRCLQALGEDTEHRHFISLIMSKLPRGLVAHLEEIKGAGTAWTVEDLRKGLHNTLNAREIAERQNDHPSRSANTESKDNTPKQRNVSSGFRSTIETLTASDKASSNRHPTSSCIFCSRSNHFYSDCRTLSTVAQRREKVRQLRRCFICLQSGHGSRDCKSTKPCFYCKQVKRHHQSLCPDKFPAGKPFKESAAVATESNKGSTSPSAPSAPFTSNDANRATLAVGEMVVLQTAWVDLYNPDSTATVSTRVLLDSGSNRTYITAKLSKQLGLKLHGEEHFSIGTFGSDKRKTVKTSNTKVTLELMDGSKKRLDVNVVDQITDSITRLRVDYELENLIRSEVSTKLADRIPHQQEKSEIGLLIGNDYYLDIVNSERIKIRPGLYLLSSRLGWIITGRIQSESEEQDDITMFIDSRTNTVVPDQVQHIFTCGRSDEILKQPVNVQDFWNLETIGINDSPETIDDDKALENFNQTVQQSKEGRYEVTWPWKEEIPDLPSNYQLALGRFRSLAKKLQTSPELFAKYRDIIQEQEKLGIIETVDSASKASLTHYIPHHPVITPSKATTKVRIVFDASAKVNKFASSLNECLYRGPVILEDLCGLLLKFRLPKVALTADIEKAFLQVGLQEADRDVTRFFWFKDHRPSNLSDRLDIQHGVQEYRFCRVPFGVMSSPFLLGATIQFHLTHCGNQRNAHVCDAIRSGLYVDNVISGTKSDQEALEFYDHAKQIFKQASMNLREWGSNSKTFLSKIPQSDQANGSVMTVLGLSWDTDTDKLSICSRSKDKMVSAATKRQILKCVASFFDPLGFFSPLTLTAKLLFRTISEQEKEWDVPLDSAIINEWIEISSGLTNAANIKLSRAVSCVEEEGSNVMYQLLCFCDASATAYAAVVYLRIASDRTKEINLVYSKTRLSPSKGISIPRMELLAAVIGMRCLKFVESQLRLPISDKLLWTDSTCVLHWLKSVKQKPVFVQNRLKELKKHPDVTFQYVKTTENLADIASRGTTSVCELLTTSWFKGPQWLQLPQSEWQVWLPDMTIQLDLEHSSDPTCSRIFEVGHSDKSVKEQQMMVTGDLDYPHMSSPYGIQAEMFSSLLKLHRVTAWVGRFLSHVRKRPTSRGCLTSSELLAAKQQWERHVQQKHFSEIFQAASTNLRCNIKEQLNLCIDSNGILRCHGRFANLKAADRQRFPVLLPKKDHYTDLVVRSVHERNLHCGVSHTLAQIREEHWILRGRSVVKTILRRCTLCKKCQGGPYLLPRMPPYPAERVNKDPPFSYVGLDYLGPLPIKTHSGIQKSWVCLFTCMAVRAIHLELVADMSTEQFLLCLRRFIARRGSPIVIISDNAAQFKLAKTTINRAYGKVIADARVKDFVSQHQIAWKFITENAPWMGGFYERLVGSVKRALRKSVGRLLLSSDQLATCLTEIESVINQRPLTHVGDSVEDLNVLTPRHFLTLNPRVWSSSTFPSEQLTDAPTSSSTNLLASWKRGNAHLAQFWKTWTSEYLNSLRERAEVSHRQPKVKESCPPAINDVVLVKENFTPRGKWMIGKICQLLTSQDGQVRSVKLRLPGNRYVQRPIKLLYPFELAKDEIPPVPEQPPDTARKTAPPSEEMPQTSSTTLKVPLGKPTAVWDPPNSVDEPAVPEAQSTSQRLSRRAKTKAIKRIRQSIRPSSRREPQSC